MHDDILSRAVTAFVWGDPPRSWPSSDPAAVTRLFGDGGAELVQRITALLAELDQVPPDDDLVVYGDRIEQALESNHPELTKPAREALARRYTFGWR
ncbi:hypothetical protein [Micromonospora sp. KC723]|uniref:hypothetical protein n=1 Tax=Micromonospora sp. KC723 TaxID=2530381 RepID=UPI0010539CF0|nr:hypothetical protein [Micromonospora sp. KC723]TDB77787.1 hypothetical protein E1165_02500 [Micromonospora sp. KC723]